MLTLFWLRLHDEYMRVNTWTRMCACVFAANSPMILNPLLNNGLKQAVTEQGVRQLMGVICIDGATRV